MLPSQYSQVVLNEHSSMWTQPVSSKIHLKDHQKTLIHRCIEFEHSEIQIAEGEHMKTSIGIIGDKVGSGKSYVILSLVKISQPFDRNCQEYKTYANNHMHIIKKKPKDYIECSLIVIPHNLCKQWEAYIEAFDSNMKVLVINKHKKIATCDLSAYDVVLVTCTMYNHFAVKFEHLTFSRIFYDEADSVNIPSCKAISSMFYWFVTASFVNLSNPYGHYIFNERVGRYVEQAKGLKNTGFIKEMFASIHQTKNLCKMVLVKNDDDFVMRSISLPAVVSHHVESKTPYAISILSNIVDKEVIRCLNANDVKRAIQYIHPSHRGTEDNIISLCVDKLTKSLRNIVLRIEFVTKMEYDVEADRQEELAKLTQQKETAEFKINSITHRVKERDQCPICFEEINEKTVLNCCSNAFCFKCLSVWLASSRNCPLCKSVASIGNVFVVQNQPASPTSPIPPDPINRDNEKMLNLINILKSKADKTLVFSQYDDGIRSIASALSDAKISFAYLKGACTSVSSTLEKFKQGDIKVLLINPIHYGSGLNMECTTDIIMFHKFNSEMENQVIGRAQRCGRTVPLNVWYLLHHNEMPE